MRVCLGTHDSPARWSRLLAVAGALALSLGCELVEDWPDVPPPECEDAQLRCYGDARIQECVDGYWDEPVDCEAGLTCMNMSVEDGGTQCMDM